ncbi:uncharacterized protein LOC134826985 [Culicoides brevitarsis]|uniref:uncharacterized protein LOC134826985 n=1 Tax=Culicoides brevitarsis TaxID=469753 RepID=UPI00307BC684
MMMSDSTPICRCRVLYLGSAVPRQSKDGLQGIQEPLKSLYPAEGALGAKGIDSWLSVWSNGILLENVDENLKQVTRFFPIESLHYCAAVRQVLIPERGNNNPEPKFLPLDSPFARTPRAHHPPIFAAILRRTTGIKVLECHTFICKREAAANALVRCCFHAYADNSYARQLENGSTAGTSVYGTLGGKSTSNGDATSNGWRSRNGSTTTINSVGRQITTPQQHHMNGSVGDAFTVKNLYASSADLDVVDDGESSSLCNGDENHKVWTGSQDHLDAIHTESPYEIYSGGHSTLGRPARQRQISMPVQPPPPPKEEPKKKKDHSSKSKPVGSQSLSGTLIRPRPVHMNRGPLPPHHPGMMMYGPPPPHHHPMMAGPPSRQFHTIGHRGHHGMAPNGHGPPMHHPMHHPQVPLPMPIMVPQQYATLQKSRTGKKKNKKDKMNGMAMPVPMPVPPIFYPPGPPHHLVDSRPLSMSNRKLAQSAGNGLDDSGDGTGTSGADSPTTGTGIYRRKGHLNERAFSYSIRQEHRSRSHGSLASLQFSPPDIKKEREIAQMVAALDINGDADDATLTRRGQQMTNGHHHGGMNGHHAPIAMNGHHMNGHGTFGKPRR